MTVVPALQDLSRTAATRGLSEPQSGTATPQFGLFGNSLPDIFPASAGFRVVDVKSVPDSEIDRRWDPVAPFIEPFVDDYVRHFLHRLGCGAFANFRAIVFCREDAAAMVAYQYALELRRQGILAEAEPALLLWNLEHGKSPDVRQFNERQLSGLMEQMKTLGGTGLEPERLAEHLHAVSSRQDLLRDIADQQAGDQPRLPASACFDIRHAMRYLTPDAAANRLSEVRDALPALPVVKGPRIALVGTALDDRRFYQMLDEVGVLVADLQPFGAVWPLPISEHTDQSRVDLPRHLLQTAAENPLSPRNRMPGQWLDKVAEICVASRCDWVVAQMDQNDDTFGWDVPPLKQRIEASGIGWINLGFRDFRPDNAWFEQVKAVLGEKMGNNV